MSSNECHACGRKWEEHKGIVWTCDELHRLRSLANELCVALLFPGLTREERFIRMGMIASEIRELNPEDFDEKVAKKCGISF